MVIIYGLFLRFILLVSSMDGSLTALDMRADGKLLWSLKDSDRPLLSSSITNVKVKIFFYMQHLCF